MKERIPKHGDLFTDHSNTGVWMCVSTPSQMSYICLVNNYGHAIVEGTASINRLDKQILNLHKTTYIGNMYNVCKRLMDENKSS